MKRYFALLSLTALALVSCTETVSGTQELPDGSLMIHTESQPDFNVKNGYVPLNFTEQVGLWMPYVGFPDYMAGRSAEEFRKEVTELVISSKNDGVNTLYFHVHPCGDAYYRSDIYPRGHFLGGDFDPLEIVLDAAHSAGVSVHAWLNPLRMQTAAEMDGLGDDFIVKRWVSEGSPNVKLVGERWFLDPSSQEVTDLIAATAAEILDGYPVDGIHVDDYFYPDDDPEFDRAEFAESGADDLGQWRRDNVTRFVKALYDTVKTHDKRLRFGVSPQGNVSIDMEKQFADVVLWAGTPGYVDYIAPQLYFGFKNAVCPFEQTLRQWEGLVGDSGVSLVVGLAEYKVGKADKWAGEAGESEWMDEHDIIPRQIELVKSSSADGYALYR